MGQPEDKKITCRLEVEMGKYMKPRRYMTVVECLPRAKTMVASMRPVGLCSVIASKTIVLNNG